MKVLMSILLGTFLLAMFVVVSSGIYNASKASSSHYVVEELIAPEQSDITEIPCTWEPTDDPAIAAALDAIWQRTSKATGVTPKLPRPKVCAREGAPVVSIEGHVGFLCGYYEPSNNTVLAVQDDRICPEFECVLVHEFIHAQVGEGHKNHPKFMSAAGCNEAPTEE